MTWFCPIVRSCLVIGDSARSTSPRGVVVVVVTVVRAKFRLAARVPSIELRSRSSMEAVVAARELAVVEAAASPCSTSKNPSSTSSSNSAMAPLGARPAAGFEEPELPLGATAPLTPCRSELTSAAPVSTPVRSTRVTVNSSSAAFRPAWSPSLSSIFRRRWSSLCRAKRDRLMRSHRSRRRL